MTRVYGGDGALRASMASIYAAAHTAPIDARNSEVLVRLGGDESSSSSSDSESSGGNSACSDPYSEPSPPKSIPKPWGSERTAFAGGATAKTAFSKSFVNQSAGTKVVVHDEKTRANQAKPASTATGRFGFSLGLSARSLSSSLCTTEGTASLNSSSSSVKVGDAMPTTSSDQGKLSVAHLTTCDEEAASNEATSELPPRLTFTLKPVSDTLTATESKSAATERNVFPAGTIDSATGCEPTTRTTPRCDLDVVSPFPFAESAGPCRLNGRTVLKQRRASLPGGNTTARPETTSPASASYVGLSQTHTALSPQIPTTSPTLAASGDPSSARPTSSPTVCLSTVSNAALDASPSFGDQSQVKKEVLASTSESTPPIPSRSTSFSTYSTGSQRSTHSAYRALDVLKQPKHSETPSPARFSSSGGSFDFSFVNEPQSSQIPRGGFSLGLSGSSMGQAVLSARATLSPLVLEISDASRVASGRTGIIYKAVNGVSTLAVKVVKKPVGKRAVARFENELVTLRRLPDYQSLVRHHGYMSLADGDKVGVITDMVIGSQSLHGRLHSEIAFHRMDETDKHRVLLQISDALALLHSHGVTHRDLSLKHVLHTFGSSPATIKLIDFGLPSLRNLRSSDDGLSANSWIGASPEYASPEVLRGELSSDDNDGWMKSDIFSFAVLMVELLTEELPWDGESPLYIANAVVKRGERPFDIDGVCLFGKKSPELNAIIREAWHENPSCRPGAQALFNKLQSLFDQGQNGDGDVNDSSTFSRREGCLEVQDLSVKNQQITPLSTSAAVPGRSTAAHPHSFHASVKSDASTDLGEPHQAKRTELQDPNSTPIGFKFEMSGLVQPPSRVPLGAQPTNIFSTPTEGAIPSVQKPLGGGVGSTPPKMFAFSNSSSYASLDGLTLTIADETRITTSSKRAIYRAFHRDGQVAVEVVRKPTTRSARLRFEKDMFTLKNLPHHPHLLRHFGSTNVGNSHQCGIVTELVFSGEPIEGHLYRTFFKLNEVDKHRILLQIVDAVSYLHAHDITHRDLSLKHVFNTYDSPPTVKLANFGLHALRGTRSIVNGGLEVFPLGLTLEYASPEALRGELSCKEDFEWERSQGGWTTRTNRPAEGKPSWKESDVYSFAVLLMEMLLEEKPWNGELPMYVMNAVAKNGKRPFKVEDIRVFGARSPALEALIQEAWHDDPAKRPTADSLKYRLERIFKAD